MIRYHESTCENIKEYNTILIALNKCIVTDEDVWETARSYDDIPDFDNILYRLTFEYITDALEESYPKLVFDINYEIDGTTPCFFINNKDISNWSECKSHIDLIQECYKEDKEYEQEMLLDRAFKEITNRINYDVKRFNLTNEQLKFLLLKLLNDINIKNLETSFEPIENYLDTMIEQKVCQLSIINSDILNIFKTNPYNKYYGHFLYKNFMFFGDIQPDVYRIFILHQFNI